MIQQAYQVVPPQPSDSMLRDFAQIIQRNLAQLFQAAHTHRMISSAPRPNDGTIGDIYSYDDGTNIYIYLKTARGWAKSTAFTLI